MKLGLTLAAASTAASTAAFCPVSVHNAQPAQSLPFNKYAPSPFAEPLSPFQSSPTSSYASVPTSLNYSDKHESNYLMDYFRTADGEIIDPYVVLKLGRGAEKQEIRQRYRTLSKQYHPDGARFTEVLPGKW
jgi:DnaJ-domain-containing protein 1